MSATLRSEDETHRVGTRPSDEDAGQDEPPQRVGPYRVQRKIGEGGMGRVFAARDERLDRTVALKSIKLGTGGVGERAEAQARLVREAQAMAALSHPNIVPVYDLVVDERGAWIALELVEGSNLRAWCSASDPDWRQRLRILVAAGRGLAAAHRAGILHRDVKPTNIMVDPAGRTARMLDFGLARPVDSDDVQPSHDSWSEALASSQSTETGLLMGTPVYMAPELLSGAAASEQSDQFSYCVTAFEILHGQRPWSGSGRRDRTGPVEVPSSTAVPSSVTDVLVRGLRPDPQERWPSMTELLDALEGAGRPSRRRSALLVGVAGIGLAAAVLATRPDPECAVDESLAGVWDEQARAGVQRKLAAGDPATATAVVGALDRFRDAFVDARRQGCEAGAADVPPQDFDRRMSCLRQGRDVVRARVEVLLEGRPEAIERAQRLVGDLPAPGRCLASQPAAGEHAVDAVVVPEELEPLRRRLERAQALGIGGNPRAQFDELEAIAADVGEIEHPDLRLAALRMRSSSAQELGMFADAVEAAVAGFDLASSRRADDDAAQFALYLAHLHGHRLAEPDEGVRWAQQAEALAPRTRQPALTLGQVKFARGSILEEIDDRWREGIADLEEARRIYADLFGDADTRRARFHRMASRTNLAIAYMRRGRLSEAEALYEELYEDTRRTLGPDHNETVMAASNLATGWEALGRHEDVVRLVETVLAETGPEALTRQNNLHFKALLIDARRQLGTADDASGQLAALVRAAADDPDTRPVDRSSVEVRLARAHRLEGHPEAGLRWARSALQTMETTHGAASLFTVDARAELAELLHATGEVAEARRHLAEVVALLQASTVPDNPQLLEARQRLQAWDAAPQP